MSEIISLQRDITNINGELNTCSISFEREKYLKALRDLAQAELDSLLKESNHG